MWNINISEKQNEKGEKYKTYGVRCDDIVVNDISLDKNTIEMFVDRLNRNKASTIHIYEMIEDLLGE